MKVTDYIVGIVPEEQVASYTNSVRAWCRLQDLPEPEIAVYQAIGDDCLVRVTTLGSKVLFERLQAWFPDAALSELSGAGERPSRRIGPRSWGYGLDSGN